MLLGNGDGTLQPKVDYTASSSPASVVIGDMNGDTFPDLIVANYGGSVSVLLNNGTGVFTLHGSYSAGSGSNGVAIGNFDVDGNPDVAVSTEGGGGAVLFLKGNGDGSLQAPTTLSTGSLPLAVAVADVSDDGNLDIIAGNGSGSTVTVFLGNGDDTFAPGVPYTSGGGVSGVSVTDIDSDGTPDLVTANLFPTSAATRVSVLIGNGDGTFQTHVDFPAGDAATWPAIGDFNGDTQPDVATADQNDDTSTILLNTTSPVVDLNVAMLASPDPSVTAGDPISWTVTVTNEGIDDDTAASVTDAFSTMVSDVTWTCTASAGSSCAQPSGTGDIAESGSTILAGGMLTYTIDATVNANATGTLSNTATAAPGAGFIDTDASDDSATTMTTIDAPAAPPPAAGPGPAPGEAGSPSSPADAGAPPPAGSPATAPPPRSGKTGNLEEASGTVCVAVPGESACIGVDSLRSIPVGSIIDATNGSVRLTVLPGAVPTPPAPSPAAASGSRRSGSRRTPARVCGSLRGSPWSAATSLPARLHGQRRRTARRRSAHRVHAGEWRATWRPRPTAPSVWWAAARPASSAARSGRPRTSARER